MIAQSTYSVKSTGKYIFEKEASVPTTIVHMHVHANKDAHRDMMGGCVCGGGKASALYSSFNTNTP